MWIETVKGEQKESRLGGCPSNRTWEEKGKYLLEDQTESGSRLSMLVRPQPLKKTAGLVSALRSNHFPLSTSNDAQRPQTHTWKHPEHMLKQFSESKPPNQIPMLHLPIGP